MKNDRVLKSKVYKVTWTTEKSELMCDLPSEAIFELLRNGAKVELFDLIYGEVEDVRESEEDDNTVKS